MVLVTLTFHLLTFKLVCSHQRWGTFIPNFGTLGLRVLELFGMYATDGQTDGQTDRQTDGQTDKSNAYCPLFYGRGHNKLALKLSMGSHSVICHPTEVTASPSPQPGRLVLDLSTP